MRKLRIHKFLFTLIFFAVLYFAPDAKAGILDFIDIGDGNRTIINSLLGNPGSPQIVQDCKKYPGFINKIVQCVTHMVTQEQVLERTTKINAAFLVVSNVMIMIYLMNFGLKLAFMEVRNVRSEIMVVLLTCAVISYVNNSVRILDYIRFFVGFQNEFANAATTAIKTRPNKYGEDSGDTSICFKDDKGEDLNIWQRLDCLTGYIIGIHPVVEKVQSFYSASGSNGVGTYNNQRFDYGLFAGKENPFANMATDGFEFLRGDNGSISLDPDKPKPGAGSKYEVYVSFSMIVIIVGMLFNSASLGMIAILTGIFIIILMIAAFGQAALVYITSLFAVLFLGMIAPIMIPMFLFQHTRKMFEMWLQQLFVYSIMPGILLVYLCFMVFVLQYVVTYSKCSGTVTNGECEVQSLKSQNFGDDYQRAFAGYTPSVTIDNDTTGGTTKTKSASDYLRSSASNTVSPKDIKDSKISLIDRGYDSTTWSSVAAQNFLGSQDKLRTETANFMANKAGTQSFGFGVPLVCLGGCTSELIWRVLGSTEMTNADIDNLYKNIMEGKPDPSLSILIGELNGSPYNMKIPSGATPLEVLAKIQQYGDYSSFKKNNNYLQNLLIVFLTLAITFSFMSNVMTIAGSISGAGVNPADKMANLYQMATQKLTRIVNS